MLLWSEIFNLMSRQLKTLVNPIYPTFIRFTLIIRHLLKLIWSGEWPIDYINYDMKHVVFNLVIPLPSSQKPLVETNGVCPNTLIRLLFFIERFEGK